MRNQLHCSDRPLGGNSTAPDTRFVTIATFLHQAHFFVSLSVMHPATCWWNPISASTKLESKCHLLGWAFCGNSAAQNMGIGHIVTLCTALHFFVRSETPKTGGVRRTSRDRVLQAGSRPFAWRGQAISICRTLRKQSKLPIPNSREMHCFPYGPRQKR